MVPFFGQGLNCGLEDVRVLYTLFLEEGVQATALSLNNEEVDAPLARALERYSSSRHDDLLAICDLAMNNYIEMRHSVTTLSYLLKKALDNLLYSFTAKSKVTLASLRPLLTRMPYPPGDPSGWIPLYTMVTFRPDISYATARQRSIRQATVSARLGWVGLMLIGAVGTWLLYWLLVLLKLHIEP